MCISRNGTDLVPVDGPGCVSLLLPTRWVRRIMNISAACSVAVINAFLSQQLFIACGTYWHIFDWSEPTSLVWCLRQFQSFHWGWLGGEHNNWIQMNYFPSRPVQSNTISISLSSIQPTINARRLLVQISTTAYNQVHIHTAEWTGAM